MRQPSLIPRCAGEERTPPGRIRMSTCRPWSLVTGAGAFNGAPRAVDLVGSTGEESRNLEIRHRTGVGGVWVGRGNWEGELWDLIPADMRARCVRGGGLSACADVLV